MHRLVQETRRNVMCAFPDRRELDRQLAEVDEPASLCAKLAVRLVRACARLLHHRATILRRTQRVFATKGLLATK
jgi:hypothetical protein